MNCNILVLASIAVLCISGTASTRLNFNTIVKNLLAGGERLCPYCSLCSYVSYCDTLCRQRPMFACFVCRFRSHCETTCKTTCKKNPCSPSPCMTGETCIITGKSKFYCTCKTPACLNKSQVILHTDHSTPV